MRLDRLRSNPWLFLAGDALLGERCNPALMAAAACNEDKDGDLGDGGQDRKESALFNEILRGLVPEPDSGSEFRSGIATAPPATTYERIRIRLTVVRCLQRGGGEVGLTPIKEVFVCQVSCRLQWTVPQSLTFCLQRHRLRVEANN